MSAPLLTDTEREAIRDQDFTTNLYEVVETLIADRVAKARRDTAEQIAVAIEQARALSRVGHQWPVISFGGSARWLDDEVWVEAIRIARDHATNGNTM